MYQMMELPTEQSALEVDMETGEILSPSPHLTQAPISDELRQQIVSTVTYEEATEMIRSLREMGDSAKWTIGDLVLSLTDGLKKTSAKEMIVRIAGDTNIDPDTVNQYKWVSSKFPVGPIREISPLLSYSHYRACTALDDPQEWLEKAADENWTIKKLQEEISIQKENKRLEREGCNCDRPGCINKVSLSSKERVAVQLFGYKFTFCGLACAGNNMINNLNQLKHKIQQTDIPVETSKTPLIMPPTQETMEMETEEWLETRFKWEQEFVREKYGNITTVK